MRLNLVALALGGATLALASTSGAEEPLATAPAPAAPAPAAPPPTAATQPATAAPSPAADLTTLRDLRERGVISEAEYQSAIRDIGESTGDHAREAPSLVFGKWTTTVYGFVEADTIYDSTQSFNDLAGNAQVQRPNGAAPPPPAPQQTYAGSNGQTQFSVRNSRFGLRLKPPGTESVRSAGVLEMDFLGSQSLGYATGQASENAFFTSPVMRMRHAYFRVETPFVDVLAGQYWHLFGWQGSYHPNTVEIQGVPGQLYSRTAQVRLSHAFKAHPVTLEIALAAMRPPARTSIIPEGEGGLRFSFDDWTGMQTTGATSTSIQPASIALTGDYRQFQVPAIDSLVPTSKVTTQSISLAADAFLPIIPASKDKRDNALSVTGEIVYGAGIADMYSGLTGGVQFPFIPNIPQTDPNNLNPTPNWPQNIDNGLVGYDINTSNPALNGGLPGAPLGPGANGFALHPIQWTSYLLGLQYYLPALKGKVWVSGNYSHMQSRDSTFLGNYWGSADFARPGNSSSQAYYQQASTGQVRSSEDWWDANVFVDPLDSLRVGLEFAQFIDHYVDGFTATNNRVQLSGFFLF
jgi:hypothetical protein